LILCPSCSCPPLSTYSDGFVELFVSPSS
jgi:hypothetical protein